MDVREEDRSIPVPKNKLDKELEIANEGPKLVERKRSDQVAKKRTSSMNNSCLKQPVRMNDNESKKEDLKPNDLTKASKTDQG